MFKNADKSSGPNDILRNKYKTNYTHYKEFIDFTEKIKKAYSIFSDAINEIFSKKYYFLEDKTNIFYSLMLFLKNHFLFVYQEYKELSSLISKEIIEQYKTSRNNDDKNEEKLNKDYNDLIKKLKKAKLKLEENKNTFLNKMQNTEKLVVEEKSIKINAITSNQEIKDKQNIAFNAICDSMMDEEKYIKSISETNSIIDEINSLEKQLSNFYQETEKNCLNKIKDNLYYLMTIIKAANLKINYDIDDFNKKCMDIKLEKEIKTLLEKNTYNFTQEKKIIFTPYKPFTSLNNSIKSSSENEEMNINYEVIVNLQKFFTKICENLDMDEEKRRKQLRTLCLRIFDENKQNYVKEDQEFLIKFMQVEEYRNYFISSLTQQRLNGKYKREEKLFNDLIELLNAILEIAEKEKNYDNARNCIILSQTFYKEKIVDGKVEKVYLMEYLKKNKWVSTSKFWKNFIEDEIIKDKIKFEQEVLKENGKSGGDVTKIYFSKLITYSHNMFMFGIKRNDAFDIINYFIKKYEISDTLKNYIISNLETVYTDKKMIVKKNENLQISEKKEKPVESENKNEIKNEINNETNNEIKKGGGIMNEIKNEINDKNLDEIKNENINEIKNENNKEIKNIIENKKRNINEIKNENISENKKENIIEIKKVDFNEIKEENKNINEKNPNINENDNEIKNINVNEIKNESENENEIKNVNVNENDNEIKNIKINVIKNENDNEIKNININEIKNENDEIKNININEIKNEMNNKEKNEIIKEEKNNIIINDIKNENINIIKIEEKNEIKEKQKNKNENNLKKKIKIDIEENYIKLNKDDEKNIIKEEENKKIKEEEEIKKMKDEERKKIEEEWVIED